MWWEKKNLDDGFTNSWRDLQKKSCLFSKWNFGGGCYVEWNINLYQLTCTAISTLFKIVRSARNSDWCRTRNLRTRFFFIISAGIVALRCKTNTICAYTVPLDLVPSHVDGRKDTRWTPSIFNLAQTTI